MKLLKLLINFLKSLFGKSSRIKHKSISTKELKQIENKKLSIVEYLKSKGYSNQKSYSGLKNPEKKTKIEFKKPISHLETMRRKMRQYKIDGKTREYYPRNKYGIKWVQE